MKKAPTKVEAPKKVEPKPVEVAKPAANKKADPFAAYRNKAREKGHGSKKI
jgi:hypothetical protein